jgi:PAS domain S-box-containing protein
MRRLEAEFSSQLLDAVDFGIVVLGADHRVACWNAWMNAAAGIDGDAAAGKALQDIFPDSNLRRLSAAIADALDSGASSLLTHSLHKRLLPLRTRAGRELIHNVSVRPIGDKPFSRCVVQIDDVTAMAHREQVLKLRQNARYDAVVNSAADAILTVDDQSVVQLANPAAGRVFGYGSQELMGKTIGLLFEDQGAWEDAWSTVLTSGSLHPPRELQGRRKDGSVSFLEVSAAHWTSESRVFVTAILRDVNERHASEAALRRLNETLEDRVASTLAERKLLADIVENTDALIAAIDMDYRFLALNPAFESEFQEVYGLTPGVGDSLLGLLSDSPQELSNAQALWAKGLSGEAYSTIGEFGDRDLNRRFYEIKFEPLRDAKGVQFGVYQIVYDISDRIAREAQLATTEEALRQSQKMEAIGQLTGGIAHDFNNLLTGIIGAMDVLKRRITARKYDDTQRFMDAAVTSANRAAALTHRLLAFARRQPLDPQAVDATALVEDLEDLFRRTLGERIDLTTDLQAELWLSLTDPNQLENALLNLVINARDAMPDGGRLSIVTRNEVFDAPLANGPDQIEIGDYAVLCVSDTGVGIPADVVDKVFDPFFTTKPIGQGTGLGLSMIYGFAKQSRGHVRIESEEGKGTQVRIYLPRFHGELPVAADRSMEDLPAGMGETVLLVEDDSSVRLLIGEVLRELGYACVEAVDGQTAMPMIASNARLDLMITDVGLPGMNGRQLAEIARQHRPDLKVLFVTGYAEHATGNERFLEAGMAMVTKPFALDALALKIRDMLSSRR